MKRTGVLIALGTVAFLVLLFYFSLDLKKHRVEVCMTFRGQTNCRTALAGSKQQALRTAIENACALISSGMSDTQQCAATPPASVKWLSGE